MEQDILKRRVVRTLLERNYEKYLDKLVEILYPLYDKIGYKGLKKVANIGLRVAREDDYLTLRFFQKVPDLKERIGYKELKKIADAGRQLAKRSIGHSIDLFENSSELIDKLGYDGFLNVLNQYSQVVNTVWLEGNTFLKSSPDIIERIGYDGLQKVTDYSCLVGDKIIWNHYYSLSRNLFEEGSKLIDKLLERGDKSLIMGVYDLCMKIAQDVDYGTSFSFLNRSPIIIDKIGLDDLEKIVNLSGQIAEVNKYVAKYFFEKGLDLFERLGYDNLEEVARISRPIAKSVIGNPPVKSDIFRRFLEKSPDIIDRVGLDGLEKIARPCCQLVEVGSDVTKTFISVSPGIISKIEYNGLKKVADLSRKLAKLNRFSAKYFLEKSPDIIDRVGLDGLKKVADLSRKLEKVSLFKLYDHSIHIIDKIGFDYFESFLKEVGEIAKHDPNEAESFIYRNLKKLGLEH